MVIQWDEPETPNGQVTVGSFVVLSFVHSQRPKLCFSLIKSPDITLAGIQSLLHDGLESTDGVVAVPDGGQQSADDHLGANAAHDLHDKGAGAHERRSRATQFAGANQDAARGTEPTGNVDGGRHRGDQSNAPMEQARS